jgi:hypothetical protein
MERKKKKRKTQEAICTYTEKESVPPGGNIHILQVVSSIIPSGTMMVLVRNSQAKNMRYSSVT